MKTFIKYNQTHIKKNDTICTINEYLFEQPSLGIAKATINGRYPSAPDKKCINNTCDLIYYVLEGNGVVSTKDGSVSLEKGDALFLARGQWYWVEGHSLEILIISAPEWTVEQYKEV